MKTNSWYVANNSNDTQGLVVDEGTGENIAVTYKAENAPVIAASHELLRALKKSAQNIEQLCGIVNTLAGFRKVRAEDFGELAYKAIEKAEGES